MKSKVLVSSILTIALCLSLIAGSTFALFTDQTKFGIEVTSGDVEIYAHASVGAVYSAAAGVDATTDEYLVDEYGHNYTHVEQVNSYDYDDGVRVKGVFTNGGYAIVEGANLKINKITPGDRVDVTINVDNKSDVAMIYRYKIIAEESNLAYGMVVSVGDNSTTPAVAPELIAYEGLATWTSEWYPAPIVEGQAIEPFTFSVELPVYAGNEYQSEHAGNQYYDENGDEQFYAADVIQEVNYTVLVEAVQGNADMDSEAEATIFPEAFARRVARGGDVDGQGAVVTLDKADFSKNTTLKNITINTNEDTFRYFAESVGYDNNTVTLGEGAVLNVATDNVAGVFVTNGNNDIAMKQGSKLVVSGDNAKGLFILDSQGTSLYLDDVNLIEVTGNNSKAIVVDNSKVDIYVPSVEAYEHYVGMIYDGNKNCDINWYVNGQLIKESYTEAVGGTASDPVVGGTYEGDVIDHFENVVALQNAALSGDAAITLHATYDTVVLENVVADVNGNLITANSDNTIILYNCDITLDEGEKIIVTAPGVTVGQVMVNNVTINGVLVETNADIAPYFEGVNLFEVWNG